MDINVKIEAHELAEAISKLADALSASKPIIQTAAESTAEPQEPVKETKPKTAKAKKQAAQSEPAEPTVNPTQAPAAPAQPATPAAPQQAAPSDVNSPSAVLAPIAAPAQPESVQATPEITKDALMSAGAALMEQGMIQQLLAALQKFGVQAISQLKKEQIEPFAAELKKLADQIGFALPF